MSQTTTACPAEDSSGTAALIGGLAALGGGLSGGPRPPPARPPPSRAPELGPRPARVDIPNRYNKPFSVADDELFIFAANFKPFELGGDDDGREATRYFDAVFGDAIRARFPEREDQVRHLGLPDPVRGHRQGRPGCRT